MKLGQERILVISAHPDDEILGCGGTIAKYIEEGGAIVQCLFVMVAAGIRFQTGTPAFKAETKRRQNEAVNVSLLLKCLRPHFLDFPSIRITREMYPDLSQSIEKVVKEFSPTKIFTHNASDNNYDHRIVFEATMTACRPQKDLLIGEIYSYEVPSATEDYNGSLGQVFTPDVFINIQKYAEVKEQALRVYCDELREFPFARSLEAIDNLAKYRGSMVNQQRCEAFRLIRKIVK